MNSKRFTALIIIAAVELGMLILFCVMNYINNFEISLTGVAACFGALAVLKGAYDAAETWRPSGTVKKDTEIVDEDL